MKFLGTINAGFPSAAEGHEEPDIDFNELLRQHPAATFPWRVKGDGLVSESIRDGSLLIIDKSLVPPPTKWHSLKGKLILAEEHGHFTVFRFREPRPMRVVGIVTFCVTKY
jgi:DNA polymerase V